MGNAQSKVKTFKSKEVENGFCVNNITVTPAPTLASAMVSAPAPAPSPSPASSPSQTPAQSSTPAPSPAPNFKETSHLE